MDAQVNAPVRIQVNEVAQNEPRRAGNEGADAPSGSLFDVRDPNLEPIIQYAIGMAGLDAVLAAPADTFAGTEVAAAFSLSFQRWRDCTKAEAAAGTIITAATAADVEATFEDLCQAFAAAGLEDNSSATAALAALKEYTVAYPTFHTNIHVGSVVVMAGLKARTDLNGTIGVVLEERGERWSIFSIADESQSIGNIKQANLTALPHPDTVGKSTEAATSREGTALLLAIGQARMEAFRALLPVSDINKVAETFRIDASCVKGAESKLDAKLMCWMRSPLMLAAQMKSTDMVRALLELDADVTATTQKGKVSALSLAIPETEQRSAVFSTSESLARKVCQKASVPPAASNNQAVEAPDRETNGPNLTAPTTTSSSRLEIIKMLLEHNADANQAFGLQLDTEAATTPLCRSVSSRLINVAEMLLQHDADPNLSKHGEAGGEVPLAMAAGDLNENMVRLLLKHGADPNHQNSKNDVNASALINATLSGSEVLVKLLLESGADVNLPFGRDLRTPLLMLSRLFVPRFVSTSDGHVDFSERSEKTQHLAIAKMLLDHGADANQTMISNIADVDNAAAVPATGGALSYACGQGWIRLVNMLIEHGADVNPHDGSASPIHEAALTARLKVLEILLENGAHANQSIAFSGSEITLMMSVIKGSVDVDNNARSVYLEAARMLVASGATVNRPLASKLSALQLAVHVGYVPMIEFLLQCGADVCQPSSKLWGGTDSLIDEAVRSKDIEVAKVLLAHGANPSHINLNIGGSPLLQSVIQSDGYIPNVQHLQLLAIYGASTTGFIGMSPIDNASSHGIKQFNNVGSLLTLGSLDALNFPDDIVEWLRIVHGYSLRPDSLRGSLPSSPHHQPWSPLMIAAFSKMPDAAATSLKLGRMDPEADSAAMWQRSYESAVAGGDQPLIHESALSCTVADAMAARVLAKESKCKSTREFIQLATSGWSPKTQWIHHRAVREAAHTVLLVSERLRRQSTSSGPEAKDDADNETFTEVPPSELWLYLLRFCLRSDWPVDITVGTVVQINGLKSRPELNGKNAVVQCQKGDRWVVQTELGAPSQAELFKLIGEQDAARILQMQDSAGPNSKASIKTNVPIGNATYSIVALKPGNLTAVSSQNLFTPDKDHFSVEIEG